MIVEEWKGTCSGPGDCQNDQSRRTYPTETVLCPSDKHLALRTHLAHLKQNF